MHAMCSRWRGREEEEEEVGEVKVEEVEVERWTGTLLHSLASPPEFLIFT